MSCPCGAEPGENHVAPNEDFEPSDGQVIAKLEREAKAIAEKLGHHFSSVVEAYVGASGATRKEWWSRCFKCNSVAKLSVRDFHNPPLRGDMLTFRCSARPPDVTRCKHCGNALRTKLCPSPSRMGPCET